LAYALEHPFLAMGDSSHRALLHFGQIAGRRSDRGNHLCPHRLHPFCSIDFVIPKSITKQLSASRIILGYFIPAGKHQASGMQAGERGIYIPCLNRLETR
jgi:hypothetical protein